jgi:hypothetical protein
MSSSRKTSQKPAISRVWKDAGADYVIIRRLHSCSGAKADIAAERRNENEQDRAASVPISQGRIVINARGDLAFCPSDWVHGSYIADYRQTTIHETWSGSSTVSCGQRT